MTHRSRAIVRALTPLTVGAVAVGTTSLVLASTASAQPANDSPVFVNELHYDNVGSDVGEFVEVAAPSGTDLSGWSVVLFNGNGGASYSTRPLAGVVPGSPGDYGFVVVDYPTDGVQNGSPDGLALVENGELRQFLSYEGVMSTSGVTSTDIGASEGSATPAGHSLQLTGTGMTYGDFEWAPAAEATRGQANTGQTFAEGGGEPDPEPDPTELCDTPATAIHDIQGSGATFDPSFGGARTVEAVVTAVMPGLSGFWVQEESDDVDGVEATSEGLFIYYPGQQAPAAGTVVRVTGRVAEFGGKTQLSGVSGAVDCGEAELPTTLTDLTFPLDSTDFERVEGMVVRFPDALVISEYFDYDRFGEVVLADPPGDATRLWTPTAVVEPGEPAAALAADYARRTIIVDDRSTAQNPAALPHPGNGDPFSLDNRFRGGDTVTGITGVLDEAFDAYRLQPTAYGDYTVHNPRPHGAPDVGGDIQVASFNVLNYFLTLDRADNRCGPDLDQDCRGANDEPERARQRAKIIAALAELDADVVGLMEMENSPGVEPAADLAAGLNDLVGAGTYDFVDTGLVGTDAIRLGFLYKPGSVRPVGDVDIFDSTDDPRFDDERNRPMLTQTFDTVAQAPEDDSQRFTVSVNHLKSKGSACAGDPDTGDGQGNCNLTRVAAAEAIVDHLATDPTGSGDPDHLIIGDLNSYDHEDPIDALVRGGYQDQVRRFGGEFAYGYVFDGQAGYLDHALANEALAAQVTGTAEWHINADEPDLLDYDQSFKPAAVWSIHAPDPYRSSDHDPVLVGLALTGAELDVRTTPHVVWAGKTEVKVHVEVSDRAGTPAGEGIVTVLDGSVVLGTAAVVDGEARVRVAEFAEAGTQQLTVVYAGPSGVTSQTAAVEVHLPRGR